MKYLHNNAAVQHSLSNGQPVENARGTVIYIGAPPVYTDIPQTDQHTGVVNYRNVKLSKGIPFVHACRKEK